MAKDGISFDRWVEAARIPQRTLTPEVYAVLHAAFTVLETQGWDFASRRLVGHFLSQGQLGLKIAQIARLVYFSRSTASRHQQLRSREVVREIHHRLSGRPYGKLLPRYAGPVAEFLVTHPEAERADVLDFMERTWNIRVSTVALNKFLKKYGLDRATRAAVHAVQPTLPDPHQDEAELCARLHDPPAPGLPVPVPPEDFFCLHPVCRSLFAPPPSPLVVADRAGLLRG